jgi:hypothetical protein
MILEAKRWKIIVRSKCSMLIQFDFAMEMELPHHASREFRFGS